MKQFASLLAAALLLCGSYAQAQKIKWETGEGLAFLKDQKVINISYDYSSVTVKGQNQDEYVQQQQDELNKDEAGKGDEFRNEWTAAREKKYQPHFEKEFNKVLKGKSDSVIVKEGNDAPYTIIIAANDMDLGKGKMLIKKPALVNFTITIVATNDPSKVLAKGTLQKVEGEVNAPKGSGWIPGGAGTVMATTATVQNRQYSNRIAEAYEKAGGILAKYIKKEVL